MKSKISYMFKSLPFVLAFFVMVGASSPVLASGATADSCKAQCKQSSSPACKKCKAAASKKAAKGGNKSSKQAKPTAADRLKTHCESQCADADSCGKPMCKNCKSTTCAKQGNKSTVKNGSKNSKQAKPTAADRLKTHCESQCADADSCGKPMCKNCKSTTCAHASASASAGATDDDEDCEEEDEATPAAGGTTSKQDSKAATGKASGGDYCSKYCSKPVNWQLDKKGNCASHGCVRPAASASKAASKSSFNCARDCKTAAQWKINAQGCQKAGCSRPGASKSSKR